MYWIKSLPLVQVISQDSRGKSLIFSSSPIFICADAQSITLSQIQQVNQFIQKQNNQTYLKLNLQIQQIKGIQSNQKFEVCTTYKEIKESDSSTDAEIGNQFLQNMFILFNISKSYIQFFVDSQCVNSSSVQELNTSPLYYLINIFQSVISFLIIIIVFFLLIKKLKGKSNQHSFAFIQEEEEEFRRNQIFQNERQDHQHSD